jgi:RNA polymerase sigma-70 factor, ECF subfamily
MTMALNGAVNPSYAVDTTLAVPAPTTDDATLVRGLRSGDADAYEALIARYEHPVYGMVTRLLDDPADAADVLQDVFLKVFRNIGQFRGECSLKTWIYRIAVNEVRNQQRWFGRHRAKEIGLEIESESAHAFAEILPDPSPGPFETALDHEVRTLIGEALQRVSPTYRTALVLREVEELPYEEIALILETSLGTVKSRIMRGREALRKELTALAEPADARSFFPRLTAQRGHLL